MQEEEESNVMICVICYYISPVTCFLFRKSCRPRGMGYITAKTITDDDQRCPIKSKADTR